MTRSDFYLHSGTFLCNFTLYNSKHSYSTLLEVDFHICGLISHYILHRKIKFNFLSLTHLYVRKQTALTVLPGGEKFIFIFMLLFCRFYALTLLEILQ